MQTIGACLSGILREQGYVVTIVESYSNTSEMVPDYRHMIFDLVIVTNTSVSPARIQGFIPALKVDHPRARIIVLSGYCPEDFVSDLKQKGIDAFIPLPFARHGLTRDVAGLLSGPPL